MTNLLLLRFILVDISPWANALNSMGALYSNWWFLS